MWLLRLRMQRLEVVCGVFENVWVSFRRIGEAEKTQTIIEALLILDTALDIYVGHELGLRSLCMRCMMDPGLNRYTLKPITASSQKLCYPWDTPNQYLNVADYWGGPILGRWGAPLVDGFGSKAFLELCCSLTLFPQPPFLPSLLYNGQNCATFWCSPSFLHAPPIFPSLIPF